MPKRRSPRGQLAHAGDELPAQSGAGGAPHARGTDDQPQRAEPAEVAEKSLAEPDNTRVNERDREGSALTPFDQGENPADREITRRIRKRVVGEDSLSFTAKNVKIITRDGKVTLRGPVRNQAERQTIERLAREVAGPSHVVNDLEVSESN